MEIRYRDIHLAASPIVGLSYVKGDVRPYNDYKLPSILKTPLIQDKKGRLKAYTSGARSTIIHANKIWFKKKGDNPVPNEKWTSGEPYGGMSYEKALTELQTSERINSRFREFGYHGPFYPAALVEYDMPFENEKKIHSAILETFGDTRVSNIDSRLIKANKLGVLLNRKFRTDVAKQIASWLGFDNRILIDAGIFPEPISYNLSNYAIYRLGDGFGISRIDFASSQTDREPEIELYDGIFREWMSCHVPILLAKSVDKFGIPFEKTVRDIELESLRVHLGEEDKLYKENGKNVLQVNKKDFHASLEEFAKSYHDSFDGKVIPQPINRKLIYEIFDKVEIPKVDPRTIFGLVK